MDIPYSVETWAPGVGADEYQQVRVKRGMDTSAEGGSEFQGDGGEGGGNLGEGSAMPVPGTQGIGGVRGVGEAGVGDMNPFAGPALLLALGLGGYLLYKTMKKRKR